MSLSYEQLVNRAKLIRPTRKLEGHKNEINNVAFSPDGKWLASVSSVMILYNLISGSQITHWNGARVISFSPNSRQLVKATFLPTIPVYDIEQETEFELTGHTNDVNSVAFSPSGNFIASASCDSTVRLWDVRGKKEFQCLKGHSGWVTSVAFSPDNRTVASGSNDRTVRIWYGSNRMEEAHCIERQHESWLNSLSFSPNGQSLVSVSNDVVRLWDVQTARSIGTLKIDNPRIARWSPNGQLLFIRSHNEKQEKITIFHVPTKQVVHTLTHTMPEKDFAWVTQALAISSDGRMMATYSPDSLNSLVIYDISSLEC